MEKSVNDIILIINGEFNSNSITLIGIDDSDLLLGNDIYGVTWDIMTQNIRIYHYGLEIVFLSKINIQNELSEIDEFLYNKLLNNLISIIDSEIIDEIESALRKYIIFERFEDAQKLHNFLKLLNR